MAAPPLKQNGSRQRLRFQQDLPLLPQGGPVLADHFRLRRQQRGHAARNAGKLHPQAGGFRGGLAGLVAGVSRNDRYFYASL